MSKRKEKVHLNLKPRLIAYNTMKRAMLGRGVGGGWVESKAESPVLERHLAPLIYMLSPELRWWLNLGGLRGVD